MDKQLRKRIVWEIVFVFATVFVFRGVWTILDRFYFFNSTNFLVFGTALGAAFSSLALYRMHCCRGSIL